MKWRSILTLLLLCLATCARAQLVGLGQKCTSADKGTLFICADTVVPVLFLTGATSEDPTAPVLVVATDVKVDNDIVIAKGSIVLTSVYAQPAHIFSINDAFLDIDIQGVSTVTGDTVALAGSLQRSVQREWSCDDSICVPAFLPVRAKVKAGTLVTALVRETIELRRAAVGNSDYNRGAGSQGVPRTYVYTKEMNHRIGLQVDGQVAGHLSPFQYGCLSLAPGEHSLKIGRDLTTIHILKGQDAYISIKQQYPEDKELTVQITDGVELRSDDVLKPTDLIRNPFRACLPVPSSLAVPKMRK